MRSRRIQAPAGIAVRPTADRVREALFEILGQKVRKATFLDLFAGSGAVGIEASSRGAARVVLVESAPAALKALEGNIRSLGIASEVAVVRTPWPQGLTEAATSAGAPFSIVFADPPYEDAPYGRILESLSRPDLLDESATVVLEHETTTNPPEREARLALRRIAPYGRAALAFYQLTAPL